MKTLQDKWVIGDGMGEWVEYYNPTGHVMVFTKDREKAMETTDSRWAYDIAGVARRAYNRRHMNIQICLD